MMTLVAKLRRNVALASAPQRLRLKSNTSHL